MRENDFDLEQKRCLEEDDEIDLGVLLRNFVQGMRKFWWLLLLLTVLGAGVMLLRATIFYTPIYRADASFTVMTGRNASEDGGDYEFYYDSTTAGQLEKTFPYILSSQLLTDAIREDLGVDVINGTIAASAIPDSNLITMSVESTSAEDAEKILDAAIRLYPEVSRFVIGDTYFNMIDAPRTPEGPYNQPDYLKHAGKGAAFGFAAAILLIGLAALLKRTVQRPEDLQKVTSMECLGNLSKVRRKSRGSRSPAPISVLNQSADSGYREGIRGLRVHVERAMEESGGSVLLVSSTAPGEGKTTVALNLAYTFASQGKRVLFIDGDLRKQNTWRAAGLKHSYGLADVLSGRYGLADAIQKTSKGGVFYLGGMRPEKNIPRVLNSRRLAPLFEKLRKEMDYIIVDAPPAEMFEDAQLLAEHADGILYVVRFDYLPKRRIVDGVADLENGGAKVLGYVFNAVPGYGYGYGYGYGKYGYGKYGYGKYGYGKSED